MSYLTDILIALAAFVFGGLAVFAFTMRKLATAEEKGSRIPDLESGLQRALAEHAELNARSSGLQVQLEQERKASSEKLALLGEAQAKLSDAFKALSSAALRENNQSFLELAKSTLEKFQETAKGDLEKRQQAISEIVKPVRESLEKVDAKIADMEKSRADAYGSLTTQVRSLFDSQNELRKETSNLVRALRAPGVRGRWGEVQLKRVVELAGMTAHCDFFEQQSVDADEGRLRPDMLVRLPGGKTIVVDAKAVLSAYLDAIEAPDDVSRAGHLQRHARQVKERVDELGRKAYWDQFKHAPEFVVLFLPGEMFFSAALENDPGLIESAADRRVVLATPTTLIALLKAVFYGWRQERLAENAQEISALGRELYERLSVLGGHFAGVGKSLNQAVTTYNKAVASIETRVFPTARKFKELQASGTSAEIDQLSQVEQMAREAQAPELLVSTDERSLPLDLKKE
ncbi:MAG: DNA recombination protein RmuC [Chthoniobacteraceae bacterium]